MEAAELTTLSTPNKMNTNNSKLEAALKYAARGWKVFPLTPNAKAPLASLVPHGVKDATKDTAKIRDWWTRQPDANVAIACGVGDCGPYVVDVDAPHGGHKHDGAASLSAAGITLPDTLTATTPNGGRHFYFGLLTPPTADKVKNCANVNGLDGVDVRTSGGYIVAPPSTIDDKCYAWTNYEVTKYLTDFPDALYLKPKPPTATAATPPPPPSPSSAALIDRARSYLATCEAAISGQGGHNAALHAAHSLVVGFNLDDSTALGLLATDYNPRCVPPWTVNELRHKVNDARAKPQKPFGYLLATNADRRTSATAATTRGQSKEGTHVSPVASAMTGATNEARYSRRRLLCDFPDPVAEEQNPRALFKNGWLRKGGGALLISVSGAGKSVAQTQLDELFAVGRDFFGITPLRPLKIAVYQAEDDDDEVSDFRNNIRAGLHPQGFTPELIEQAERNIVYHDVTGLAGDTFLDYVRYAQERDKADLLIINPLQSFAGCDISKNDQLSLFLRVRLNPILANPTAPCAALVIHHTNKVPSNAKDRKAWLDTNSAAYAGAGGAELVNWARAVLTLRPHEVQGFYDLIAAKRGKRLGWKDAEGSAITVKTIAHSEGLMFWREPSPEEVAAAESKAHVVDDEARRRVVELVENSVDIFTSEVSLVKAIGSTLNWKPTKARKIIKDCVANGELVKHSPSGTNAKAILTPLQLANMLTKPRKANGGDVEDEENNGFDFYASR